jgi:hypothetical protein
MPDVTAECRYCDQVHGPRILCDPAKRVLDALYAQGQRFDMPTVVFPEPVNHADAFGADTVLVAQVVVKAAVVPVAGVPRPVLVFTGRDSDGRLLPQWLYCASATEILRVMKLVSDMGELAIRTARKQAGSVHGSGWNSAARWGGWTWREPRYGDFFRTCSFCGSIHPEDLAAETAGTGTCRACGKGGWYGCFDGQSRAGIKGAVQEGKLEVSDEERARVLAMTDEHSYDPGGWYASWADRKYGWPHKFYVEGLSPRDPSLLHCIGHGSGGDGRRPDGDGDWIQAKDLTRAQKRIVKDDGMHGSGKFDGWYLFAPRVTLHAKFYTVHLADPAIGQDVKDAIQRISGLRFTFTDDGRVGWQPWEAAS